MTQVPQEEKKPGLWTLVAESDLTKTIPIILWTIGLAGGMAWWVISRDQVHTLSETQVTILTARLDKVEGKQDKLSEAMNAVITNQAVGKEKQDSQTVIVSDIQKTQQTILQALTDIRDKRGK